MELCPNEQSVQILAGDRSLISQILWNLSPSDDSMENNDEYFGWTDELKIDEEGRFSRAATPNNNNVSESKTARKRKLSDDSGEPLEIKTVNGYKSLRDPLGTSESVEKAGNAKRNNAQNGTSRMPPWQVEDISDLNADLEGSLTGLGGDLSNNSYNMSETILSLPGLPVFKQEAPSPTSNDAAAAATNLQQHVKPNNQSPNCLPVVSVNHTNSTVSTSNDGNNNHNIFNNTLHHLLGASAYSNLQNAIDNSMITSPTPLSQENYVTSNVGFSEDCRFQYVLAAATSIATKVNEDTLTYLNQGQSYEIKLKKLGDLSTYRGKLLKSIIRICFHERRLQYMEREQMSLWQQSRPGDRILEVDVPLSYGLCDVTQPLNALNSVMFTWDPTKEVGVYIKVNCISTEFTPKKHGGEKGVPFRIQVETFQAAESLDNSKRLHAAACQIKVFKLKGADRKHKQDREKILKRPVSEQEKFQPSYECTVLNDIPFDAVVTAPLGEAIASSSIAPYSPESGNLNQQSRNNVNQIQSQIEEVHLNKYSQQELSPATSNDSNFPNVNPTLQTFSSDQLIAGANPQVTTHWLTANRFDKYLPMFTNFSGADMLRMTRDDLIQICGKADGIRLYNSLHSKAITPTLTLYISRENATFFNAIFLYTYNNMELLEKLSALVGIPQDQIRDIYMLGPQSIHIHVNSDVIKHIKEDTTFNLEVIQDSGSYIFVLKSINKQ